MGLLIGGAVFPTAFAIIWRKQSKAGAISGCLVGLAAGLTAWLVTAKHYYGEITIETTGLSYPTLAGNLAAVMTGLIVSVAVSLVRPDSFDWEITRMINAEMVQSTHEDCVSTPKLMDSKKGGIVEPSIENLPTHPIHPTHPTHSTHPTHPSPPHNEEKGLSAHLAPTNLEADTDDPDILRHAFKLACIASFVITFLLDFLIPMPMFFSEYVFSKNFFTGWVVISFIWVFCSSAITCLLPIWETRHSFLRLVKRVGGDIGNKKVEG